MSDEKNNSNDKPQQPGADAEASGQAPESQDGTATASGASAPTVASETSPVAASETPAAGQPRVTGSPLASSAATAESRTSRGGTSVVGWLALLLVIVLGAAAAWVVQQAVQRETALAGRVAAVESGTGNERDALLAAQQTLTAAQDQWRRELDQALASMQGSEAARERELQGLRQDLIGLGDTLASFTANDHQSWLRAEVQYLLRLANQRLIMARDVDSALALLGSADAILKELDDPTLYEVRAAVAAEQAALRAVPRVDVEGIYLRLSALIEQAGELVIFQLPELEEQPEGELADDWQTRLQRGYEDAARKLSDYVVIRRRDVPMQALMDPQWEGLVRQNLRMLLEQAQVALLSGNQTLYEESLERAQHWVAQFFESDEAAARAMAREITQLSGQTVATTLPDLARSLNALDEAARKRLQQGGQG